MQRRTYDVVNILKVIGVVREEIDSQHRKWLTYDPYMLEGAEAAEVQNQEAWQRDQEIGIELTKERIEQKLRTFRSQFRQIIQQRRLFKRNKNFNRKPVSEQPYLKLQAPSIVVKLVPETHSRAVVEYKQTHANRVRASFFCCKPPRIWDTERIISRLLLDPVQDERSEDEILGALGATLGNKVLSMHQQLAYQEYGLSKMLRDRSQYHEEVLEQRRQESLSPSPVKMRSAHKSTFRKSA